MFEFYFTLLQPKHGLFVDSTETLEQIDGRFQQALLRGAFGDAVGDGVEHHRIIQEQLLDDRLRGLEVEKAEAVDPLDRCRGNEVGNGGRRGGERGFGYSHGNGVEKAALHGDAHIFPGKKGSSQQRQEQ